MIDGRAILKFVTAMAKLDYAKREQSRRRVHKWLMISPSQGRHLGLKSGGRYKMVKAKKPCRPVEPKP